MTGGLGCRKIQHQGRHMKASTLSKMIMLAGAVALPMQAEADSFLCIEDESIGYNWEGNKWVPQDFNEKRHIITDIPNNSDLVYQSCADAIKRKYGANEVFDIGNGNKGRRSCYNFNDFGGAASDVLSLECFEVLDAAGGLIYATCDSNVVTLRFMGDGKFFISYDDSAVDPYRKPGDTRTSLVMAVGKCSRID